MPILKPERAVGSRATESRDALLDATLELIADGGIAAVTHRAVAARTGLANGATTYHFATADLLLEAALRHLAEREVALVGRLLEQETSPRKLARFLATRLSEDPRAALARFELFAESARRPALRPALGAWRRAYVGMLAGWFDDPDAEARAAELLNLLNGALLEAAALDEQAGLTQRLETAIARAMERRL